VVAWAQDGPCSASSGTIPIGEWTHIAAVLDSGTWSIWIDGRDDYSPGVTSLVSVMSDQPMRIGTTPYGDNPWGFKGNIDEMRLMTTIHYAESFSPSAHPIPETGTVGLWHFDEGEGTTAEDDTVDGLDADIEGATWSSASTCDAEG